MDAYERAASAFNKAYKNQLAAQDGMRRSSEKDEARFGDYVQQSEGYVSGAPTPPVPPQNGEAESGFDPEMDDQIDKVEAMKNGLMSESKSRLERIAPSDF
jgi:hypothetical protein